MQINTNISLKAGAGGDSRKARIVKQIQKLQAEMRRLMKKLGSSAGGESGGGAATAKAAFDTFAANKAQEVSVAKGEDAAAQTGPSNYVTISGNLNITGGSELSLVSSDYVASDEDDIEMSPEEIMKMIQVINAQIMNLTQQLGDDAMLTAAMAEGSEEEEESGESGQPVTIRIAAPETSAPAPVSVSEGHVDGYA